MPIQIRISVFWRSGSKVSILMPIQIGVRPASRCRSFLKLYTYWITRKPFFSYIHSSAWPHWFILLVNVGECFVSLIPSWIRIGIPLMPISNLIRQDDANLTRSGSGSTGMVSRTGQRRPFLIFCFVGFPWFQFSSLRLKCNLICSFVPQTYVLLQDGWMGLDCGPKSRELFAEVVKRARVVVWNG